MGIRTQYSNSIIEVKLTKTGAIFLLLFKHIISCFFFGVGVMKLSPLEKGNNYNKVT